MKTAFALLLLIATFASSAQPTTGQVPLVWSPSPTPGVTNYILWGATNTLTSTNLNTAMVALNCGVNTNATAYISWPGQWNFVVTAVAGGVMSPATTALPILVPQAPTNLMTVVVQYSTTLTNWANQGYWRVELKSP